MHPRGEKAASRLLLVISRLPLARSMNMSVCFKFLPDVYGYLCCLNLQFLGVLMLSLVIDSGYFGWEKGDCFFSHPKG